MRTINIEVNGNFCRKDSNNAGTQGEASATTVHLTFSDDWAGYAKRIVWRNAKGEQPTAILLPEPAPYESPIPPEALTEAGWCSFTVEGFLAGDPQDYEPDHIAITATDYLKVAVNDNEYAPAEPTPSQALQLQAEIDELSREIAVGGVQKVNDVLPDEEGNVDLEPADIGAYEKPDTGIPLADLNPAVQTSILLGASAYRLPSGGVPESDLSAGVKATLDLAGSSVQPEDISGFVSEDEIDDKDAEALATAKSYADGKASTAETNAKNYADARVTANPSGTATTQLTKIKVGNVIYEVQQGGSGGKVVVTAAGGVASMSAYDILRAALNSVVEFADNGSRLPLKYADTSVAMFAGTAENNGVVSLVTVMITGNTAVEDAHVLYVVPTGGIPKIDLAQAVQISLGKADTAAQPGDLTAYIPRGQQASKTSAMTQEVGISSAGKLYVLPQKTWGQLVPDDGIPKTDLASAVQASLGKADTAVQPSGLTGYATQADVQEAAEATEQAAAAHAESLVVANPTGEAYGTIRSIKIRGFKFDIAHKSIVTVEPNQGIQYIMSKSMSDIYADYEAGRDVVIQYEDPYTNELVDCGLVRIDGFDSAVFVGYKINTYTSAVTAIVFTAMNNLADKYEIALGGSGGSSSASTVTITDTAGYYTSGNVEGALAEIGAQLDGLEGTLYGLAEDLEDTL